MQPTIPHSRSFLGGALAFLCTLFSAAPAQAQATIGPKVACFAEGTSQAYMDQVQNLVFQLNGSQFFLASRWSGAQGSPRTITWSLAPDGLSIPGDIGEPTAPNNLFASLDADFAAQGGRATWIARITACFARWSQLSGITFTRITSGGNDWDDGAAWGSNGSASRGDIRISAHAIDGGSGTLAYAGYPSDGDIVMDSAENWGSSTNLNRFLRNTVMHEMGHALGIAHVCASGVGFLMEPLLSTSFDGPQHDDLRAVERHYGDPFESDDNSGGANDLGPIAVPGSHTNACTMPAGISGSNPANTSVCSIDADAEQDWWKFTLASPAAVTVTITPMGFTYENNQQNVNGTCPSGATTNSLAAADLNLQVVASNGSTVLSTAAAAAAGLPETATNVSCPAGVVFLRVYEGGVTSSPQLYRINITTVSSCAGTPDCNNNGVLDSCDILQGTSFDLNANGVPDECESSAFCFGDGTLSDHTTNCPCGNFGDQFHGCAHSFSITGALLTATGVPSLNNVVLHGSEMPSTAFGLYMQHDAAGDQVFHDGVLCASGNLIRLRGRAAVGGASMFPDSSFPNDATLTLAQRGGVIPGTGAQRYYATWYRNASTTFCPPATANVTNGWKITW